MTTDVTEITAQRGEKMPPPEMLFGDPVMIRDGPARAQERQSSAFGCHTSACPKKPRRRVAQVCQVLLWLLCLAAAAEAAGAQPDLMVKLASEGDASYLGRGIFEPFAQTQTRTDGTFLGTASVYRVLLQNSGAGEDSFTLKGTGGAAGFTVAYLDMQGADRTAEVTGPGLPTGPLAPGGSFHLLVQVTPRSGDLGVFYAATVTASSKADPAKVDQVKTETVICGTAAAVTVSVPPDATGLPGAAVLYPYTVTNVGNKTNTFALSVSNSAGWPVAMQADNQPVSSTGALSPGQSYRLAVAVTVPPDSSDLAYTATTLAVTGEGTFAYDEVKTTALAAKVTVAENVRNITLGGPFAPVVDAFPGDTLEYRMSVTNSGSVAATAVSLQAPLPEKMKYQPGTVWMATSSEGDGAPCPQAQCGSVQQETGMIRARVGEGAGDAAGGSLAPGKTIHVFYRMQVE